MHLVGQPKFEDNEVHSYEPSMDVCSSYPKAEPYSTFIRPLEWRRQFGLIFTSMHCTSGGRWIRRGDSLHKRDRCEWMGSQDEREIQGWFNRFVCLII